jgi:cytochrome c oxidase assembly protein subunit 11
MKRDQRARNVRLAAAAFGVAAVMVGVSFAAVPLYEAFCRVTGFAGTPKVAEAAPEKTIDRTIVIRFNADVDPALPWRFGPAQDKVELRVGEHSLAFYRAKNLSDHAIVGTASFNVTPLKAGQYFNKIECFCFTEQRLEAGGEADMPVAFFIDPAIADDPNLNDVREITLSYTFYQTRTEDDRDMRAATARPKTDG